MQNNKLSGWKWIPTLYFAEGIPYILVMVVSVILYKRLGLSNTDIALYTSWLYLPWVIKPFWSPFVDIIKSKRYWIVMMQLIIGAGLAGVALSLDVSNFFQMTLAFLWLIAFSSATHDIAADGFYMLALDKSSQAFFVGIRSTFYRIAMIAGQGLLVILAGNLETSFSNNIATIELNKSNSLTATVVNDNYLVRNIYNETTSDSILTQDSLLAEIKSFNNGTGKSLNYLQLPEDFYISVISLKENVADNKFLKVKTDDKYFKILSASDLVYMNDSPNNSKAILFKKISNNTNIATITIDEQNIIKAWQITFAIAAIMFLVIMLYHKYLLPKPIEDKSKSISFATIKKEFAQTIKLFFAKDKIFVIVLFLLFYRIGEGQLAKLAAPFLLDDLASGGLGLSTENVGIIYGSIGILALVFGGILGGVLTSRDGLKKWLWWMIAAINIPNVVYIYMAFIQPESFVLISILIALEQFGYGFGFTAYLLYMIYISDGNYKTSHYAIATGFMALGMMIPGMISGWLQELFGYQLFFVWVLISTSLVFVIAKFIPLKDNFGIK